MTESRNHSILTIILLFVILMVMYGQFIGGLGFYWDDWNKILLFERYGSVEEWGKAQRPFSYLIADAIIGLFGVQPLSWHLFQFCLRLASAVVVFFLIRSIYPSSRLLASVVSLLFLTFPGFTFHAIAQSHSIGTNSAILRFLLSLWLMVLSLTVKPKGLRWLYGILAVILMIILFIQQEYFVTAELIRPLLIWYILGRSQDNRKKRLNQTVVNWLPYLIPFSILLFHRLFIYHPEAQMTSQTHLLHYYYLERPINTIYTLGRRVIRDIYQALLWLWIPDVNLVFRTSSPRVTVLRLFFGLLSGLLTAWLIARGQKRLPDEKNSGQGRSIILHGMIYFILSMGVIWLTMNYISATYHINRYSSLIPLIGLALIFGAILVKIQPNKRLTVWVVAALVALGVMAHYQSGIDFRRDWKIQKSIWNQVRWRCPHIKEGTILVVNYKPSENFNVRPQQLHPVANLLYDDGSEELNLFAMPIAGNYSLYIVNGGGGIVKEYSGHDEAGYLTREFSFGSNDKGVYGVCAQAGSYESAIWFEVE